MTTDVLTPESTTDCTCECREELVLAWAQIAALWQEVINLKHGEDYGEE